MHFNLTTIANSMNKYLVFFSFFLNYALRLRQQRRLQNDASNGQEGFNGAKMPLDNRRDASCLSFLSGDLSALPAIFREEDKEI